MPEDPTFSRDGRILSACNRSNRSILFWDTRTGKLIQETFVDHKPTLVVFHPHEPIMAMPTFGGIQLWSYELAIDDKSQSQSIKLNTIWKHDLGTHNAFSIRFSEVGSYMAWDDSPNLHGLAGNLNVMNYQKHELVPFSASNVPVYNGFDFIPGSSNISFFQTDQHQQSSKGVIWNPITNQHVVNSTSDDLPQANYSSVYRNHPHLPIAVIRLQSGHLEGASPQRPGTPLCIANPFRSRHPIQFMEPGWTSTGHLLRWRLHQDMEHHGDAEETVRIWFELGIT